MAERSATFPASTAGVSRISVTSRSGRVEVSAEARSDIEVSGARRAALERDAAGEHVVADGSSDRIVVRCPVGTNVFVGTLSGRVELTGRLGGARVTTSSAKVVVAEAESVDVRTRSGTIRVARCDGVVRARTTSARVTVEKADEIQATTTSGSIVAESVRGAKVRSTSGRVALGLHDQGSVAVHTVSGGVEISVPAGAHPELLLQTVSGRVDSSAESGHDGIIGVKTISGRIRIHAR